MMETIRQRLEHDLSTVCQDRLERFGRQVAREAMELEFDEV